MQYHHTIADLRAALSQQSKANIGLVPTMGNLHEGHLSLVRAAKQQADLVVVSIFVNPAQFELEEDFEHYPNTLGQDQQLLAQHQVDIVFIPSSDTLYPEGYQTKVTVTELDKLHCGGSRPNHFCGVATVVAKLFNIVSPNMAFFGKKDYQQWLLIQQMTKDLNLPIKIIGMPTIREADGLAISSRNQYLTPKQRTQAPMLYQTLKDMATTIKHEQDYPTLEQQAMALLQEHGFKPEYVHICDAKTLGTPTGSDIVILASAYLGEARLIDNIMLSL